LRQLAQRLRLPDMATLVYLVFDPDSDTATFTNAGHPPPLLIERGGRGSFLEEGLGPPLGASSRLAHSGEATCRLPEGSTLLLFTDGLVERRGVSLNEGLARLKAEAAPPRGDLEAMCDGLLRTMLDTQVDDDVALVPLASTLHLRLPAEPYVLAPLRQTLRRWLRAVGADPSEGYDILVACGEACANAIQHPYGARAGALEVDLALIDGEVEVTVRDSGTWRSASPPAGGRGLRLMRELMDRIDVEPGRTGTMVRMRRRLGARDRERTRTS